MNTKAAPFLDHNVKEQVIEEPTQIIRNPEGSMARTAANASALAKQRQELRRQQQEENIDRPAVCVEILLVEFLGFGPAMGRSIV